MICVKININNHFACCCLTIFYVHCQNKFCQNKERGKWSRRDRPPSWVLVSTSKRTRYLSRKVVSMIRHGPLINFEDFGPLFCTITPRFKPVKIYFFLNLSHRMRVSSTLFFDSTGRGDLSGALSLFLSFIESSSEYASVDSSSEESV